MKSDHRIAAAVLIGGKSSRMGRPKEDIVIPKDGRTFLDRICDEVDVCFGTCLCKRYLSVRKGQTRAKDGFIVVEDEYDGIGPLGALVSVLNRAAEDKCDAVLLLACDMICYPASEIIKICGEYKGQDILFARTDKENLEPLASIYGVNLTETARMMAESGEFKLRALTQYSDNISYYDSDDPGAYKNVNKPDQENSV